MPALNIQNTLSTHGYRMVRDDHGSTNYLFYDILCHSVNSLHHFPFFNPYSHEKNKSQRTDKRRNVLLYYLFMLPCKVISDLSG